MSDHLYVGNSEPNNITGDGMERATRKMAGNYGHEVLAPGADPLWALHPDHYEAVLDAWLESTSVRGKQWTGVSDDSRFGQIHDEG